MSFLFSSGLRSTIPDTGDYQWYIDAGSGTTLDADVGSVTATTSGGPTWISDPAGVGGAYLDMDGADDGIQVDSSVGANSVPFTVFGWFRPRDFTGFENELIAAGREGSDTGYSVDTEGTDGELLTNVGTSSRIRNHPFVSAGEWGFVAFIQTSTEHRLITWANTGSALADATDGTTRTNGTSNLEYGVNRGAQHFDGDVDFIGAANTVLSKTELKDLRDATRR